MNKMIMLGLFFVATVVLAGCAATNENVAGGAISAKTGEQIRGDEPAVFFRDGTNIQSTPQGLEFNVIDKATKQWSKFILDRQGSLSVPSVIYSPVMVETKDLALSNLEGKGNAYVCVNERGLLFRSDWPCTGNSNSSGYGLSKQDVAQMFNTALYVQKGQSNQSMSCDDACEDFGKTCVYAEVSFDNSNEHFVTARCDDGSKIHTRNCLCAET